MENVTRLVCEAIHVNFPQYFANFPPNNPIRLGDFGNLRNDIFMYEGNLESNFGIELGIVKKGQHGNLKFNSSSSISIINNIDLETTSLPNTPEINGGISIKFGAANSVLFSATGCSISAIENKINLGEQIINLLENDKWDNWYVVTSIIEARTLHLYVSGGENASVTLKAKVNTGSADLFDAGIDSQLVSESQITTKFVGEKGTIPIIGLSRLSKSLFGKHVFKAKYLVGNGKQEDLRKALAEGKASGKVSKEILGLIDIDDTED